MGKRDLDLIETSQCGNSFERLYANGREKGNTHRAFRVFIIGDAGVTAHASRCKMVKNILILLVILFCANVKAQENVVFDTTFKRKDLDKINSFAPFIKIPGNCNISQFYVYFRRKGQVSMKI